MIASIRLLFEIVAAEREMAMQRAWKWLASYSLVRSLAWKLRVDRRLGRPVPDDVAVADRRRVAR